eukprot:1386035-Rhodomonas_salina.3
MERQVDASFRHNPNCFMTCTLCKFVTNHIANLPATCPPDQKQAGSSDTTGFVLLRGKPIPLHGYLKRTAAHNILNGPSERKRQGFFAPHTSGRISWGCGRSPSLQRRCMAQRMQRSAKRPRQRRYACAKCGVSNG